MSSRTLNTTWWNKPRQPGPTCPDCVTHPTLVQSGYSDPKSLECPVCKTTFNSNGIKTKHLNYEDETHRQPSQEELEENEEWGFGGGGIWMMMVNDHKYTIKAAGPKLIIEDENSNQYVVDDPNVNLENYIREMIQ